MLPRASLVSLNITLDYKCPNCRLCFRLHYDSLEIENSKPLRCENCQELIMADSPVYKKKRKQGVANKETQSKIRRVKKSLVRMGWTASEAKEAIEQNDMTADEKAILKQIVSSNID
jgi:predicted Zn finger-like uncharacterized protein